MIRFENFNRAYSYVLQVICLICKLRRILSSASCQWNRGFCFRNFNDAIFNIHVAYILYDIVVHNLWTEIKHDDYNEAKKDCQRINSTDAHGIKNRIFMARKIPLHFKKFKPLINGSLSCENFSPEDFGFQDSQSVILRISYLLMQKRCFIISLAFHFYSFE